MIELRVLGRPGLWDADGAPLESVLVQPKQVALLVYLALTSRKGYTRRDAFLGVFWPERDERHARASLKQATYVLRQNMGGEALLTRGAEEVRLNPDRVWCDVWAFNDALETNDLQRAAALYRGPLLEGFFLRETVEFDQWVERERHRLAEAFERAVEALADQAVARRDCAAAVEWSRRLAEHNPYATRVAVRYMEALALAGDRAEALAYADRHGARLRAELDADPSPEVLALANQLRHPPAGQDLARETPKVDAAETAEFAALKTALAGRYTIEAELGVGGMATVYLAEDLKHQRKVAVKVLKPELRAVLGADRFIREVEVTSHLDHPHIVPLFDSGKADGFLYYVMPYVEGESLRERLNREKQLQVDDAVRIAREVADALNFAHQHDIVHRDIKPDNILLAAGHARVADFGIARAISEAGGDRSSETGISVGTPPYMSPEQASVDREVDPRADLYALGCVVYEMLAGDPPFSGSTPSAILARKLAEPPPSLRAARDTLPLPLEQAVLKALARRPADRFTTLTEFADALSHAATQGQKAHRLKASPLRELIASALGNRRMVIVGLIGIVAVAVISAWAWAHQSRVKWARTIALPEATRLVEQGRTFRAYRLLRAAENYIPDDPVLEQILVEATTPVTVHTTPPGSEVYTRDFFDEPNSWEFLGAAPLNDLRLPTGTLVWRIAQDGFQTKEVLGFTPVRLLRFALQPGVDVPPGMVHVPGGPYEVYGQNGVLDEFLIDKFEVTNREFKIFVDRGGYQMTANWPQPFMRNGQLVPWEEGLKSFRDRTGRPGPATWEVGTYPEGQSDYPVGGVSWFEAAAYCASVGKELPTVYHWYQAAQLGSVTDLVEFGNFAADGPAEVGHPLRLGAHGTYDMAGNVKEWCWNQADSRRRYILGGGWHEPSYQFHVADAQDPWGREPVYGVRCAKYQDRLPRTQTNSVASPFRDYRRETPANEEVFSVYRSLYEYDRTPLQAQSAPAREEFEDWSVEHVSFVAAYDNERVPARLFLPKSARPPYQAVVFFPGGAPFFIPTSGTESPSRDEGAFLFLVRSGRAVIVPTYKGSRERYVGSIYLPHIWRDVLIHAAKDLRRAVDYLETRPDIDSQRLAYYGLSMGAAVGPIMTAVERRFAASVLLGGGLFSWQRPPESESFHFSPRVSVPTLMINGRHDFLFPHETSQVPMYQMLGTPASDKRHRVFDSGHVPMDRTEVFKEALDWLDRYLGPVNRR